MAKYFRSVLYPAANGVVPGFKGPWVANLLKKEGICLQPNTDLDKIQTQTKY